MVVVRKTRVRVVGRSPPATGLGWGHPSTRIIQVRHSRAAVRPKVKVTGLFTGPCDVRGRAQVSPVESLARGEDSIC